MRAWRDGLTYSGADGRLGDALWAAKAGWRRAREVELAAAAAPAQSASSQQSAGAGTSWRPCKRIRRATCIGDADRILMAKWCARLSAILEKGDTPSWRQARNAADPASAIAGFVGKARPTTVKKRVRDWEVMTRWLQWFRGRQWPACSTDLVDYLAARVAQGCPPSFPESLRSAVLWVEARTGHKIENTFGREEFFKKNVDRAAVVAMTEAEAVKKAPCIPLIVIAALECRVMNMEAAMGMRVMAWSRLLKVFGVMRWDDLQRLRPRDASLRASGLVGLLTQTKTSGAGKKVRDLPLFIPGDAYVLCAEWLRTGHGLWSQLGSKGRDYFLPRFTEDLENCFNVPASSGDLAILGRKVLEETKVPVWGSDGSDTWSEGPMPLVPGPLLNGWSGHSERCTLPSLFAAMGIAKQDRDPLGRWSPSGSDDYVRTYRALVQSLAKRLRTMLGEGNVFKDADEEEAIEDVKVYAARSCGEEPEVLQEAADHLIATAKLFYGLLSMSPGDVQSGVPRVPVVVDAVVEDVLVGPRRPT